MEGRELKPKWAGQKPVVSIVIPCLDANGPMATELLDSIEENVSVPHEVILVDNGGAPQGYVPPTNAGAKAARGDYIAFLNDDMKVLPGWWPPLQEELDRGTPVVCSFCVNGNVEAIHEHHNAWCVICRRDALEEWPNGDLGLYDPRFKVYWADRDLYERMNLAGTPIVTVRESECWHMFTKTIGNPEVGGYMSQCITEDREEFFAKWPQLCTAERYVGLARMSTPTQCLVFSTDGSAYQNYQAELQEWSYKRAGMPGDVVVLTDKFDHGTGPQYMGMNKPYALSKWAESGDLPDIVLVTDPDCVFLRGWEVLPELGRPWGQKSQVVYPMDPINEPHLKKHCAERNRLSQIGCIFAYRKEDFKRMAKAYYEWTHKLWEDPVSWEHFGWMCDMYGYLLAEYHERIPHVPVQVCWTNLEGRADAPMVHYAYENNSHDGSWRWHKWEYVAWNHVPDPPDDSGVDPATRAFIELLNIYVDERSAIG